MNTYIATFALDVDEQGAPFNAGRCVAIVQAAAASEALDKFRALLQAAKERDALFAHVLAVYVEGFSELAAVPREGLIAFAQLADPAGGSIHTSNLGPRRPGILSYTFGDPNADEDEPFITFE